MKKVALVIDKNDAYLRIQKNKLLKKWNSTEIKETKTLNENNSDSLFGDIATQILFLENSDAIKKTLIDLEKLSTNELSDYEENGLIIITSVARTSTRKIETFFKKNNWETIFSTKEDDPLPIKILSNLNLNKEVKSTIVSYVGDNINLLLPIVESLENVPKHLQSKITIEDLYIRIPQEPGSVPPWEVEQALMKGNLSLAIEKSRRINYNSNFLLWLTVLKTKMYQYYLISELLENNPKMKDAEITSILKLNPRGFYYTKKTVMAYNSSVFRKGLDVIIETESKVKGGSRTKPTSLCEILLIQLHNIFTKGI